MSAVEDVAKVLDVDVDGRAGAFTLVSACELPVSRSMWDSRFSDTGLTPHGSKAGIQVSRSG